MGPIRVVHVLGKLNMGGAETMVMNLYRAIDKNIVQFDFVIHTNEKCDYTDEILMLGGKIYSCPRYEGINHFSYVRWWNRFYSEHPEYRIVHGHVRSTASIYVNIAKKFNVKTIVHSHSTSNGSGLSALVKNVMQYPIRFQADYMFACSDKAGMWLFGKRALSKKNYYMCPNAIDVFKYNYDSAIGLDVKREFNLENKFVIGTVGRITEAKNPNAIIGIFECIYNRNKTAHLLWVGSGNLDDYVVNQLRAKGLENAVTMLGTRKDVSRLLQAMDVFILPSKWEGLGIVVIEAQAAGIQCYVSDKVPQEVNLSGRVKYFPADDAKDYRDWAKEIEKSDASRYDAKESIVDAGYDIFQSAQDMKDFYLRIMGVNIV